MLLGRIKRPQSCRKQSQAAIIYSLVASCKLNKIDPFAYFRDVLGRISTHTASKIDELLPDNWEKPQKKAENTAEEIAA
ncbi:MAG: hypothetical protein A2Y12_18435 [Planctomycetes bacterium GWF2_42_9]|nr:MAG: hypothetical protein A2Y12_18435 [Planctomycetes bacterium GWF2_42_9]